MKKILLTTSLFVFLGFTHANAHIVGLGWEFGSGGLVTFSALHWHSYIPGTGDPSVSGEMYIDGTPYAFTSHTWDTTSMTGLDGALTNPSYSSWDGAGTLSATSYADDWLHFSTILQPGSHTLGANFGPGGLTSWTLSGNVQTFAITAPPSAVPEPTTMLLFGAGLAGIAGVRKRKN